MLKFQVEESSLSLVCPFVDVCSTFSSWLNLHLHAHTLWPLFLSPGCSTPYISLVLAFWVIGFYIQIRSVVHPGHHPLCDSLSVRDIIQRMLSSPQLRLSFYLSPSCITAIISHNMFFLLSPHGPSILTEQRWLISNATVTKAREVRVWHELAASFMPRG